MDSIDHFLSELLISDASTITIGKILISIGIAYLGGILASLTPCVYPMIPITIGVVGGLATPAEIKQRSREKWRSLMLRMLVYVCGMAIVYAFLGVAAGLTGKVFGTLTNTHGFYLVVGVLLSLAALIMLGVIPFDPLVWWQSLKRKLGFKEKAAPAEMTLLGAFSLGATSGLVAAPCTTPILTGILAYIAKTQSVGVGLVLMLSFSLGLATFLLLIATFAGFVQLLPKSGQWMNRVKLASGLILLGFGEYLIYLAGKVSGA